MVGSPPPSRAATMMARLSLLNSLPRLASTAPFLCLIVAHWECPDTNLSVLCRFGARRGLPGQVQEAPVQARVPRQLGVERGHHDRTLARGHGLPVERGHDLDTLAQRLDPGGADEDAGEGGVLAGEVQRSLERTGLAAVAVAAHGEVDAAEEQLARQAVAGLARSTIMPAHVPRMAPGNTATGSRRPEESRSLPTVVDSPPGRTRASEASSSARRAHLAHVRAQPAQHRDVLAEGSLKGQYPDPPLTSPGWPASSLG